MALYLYKNGTWNWSGTPNRVTTPSLCYYQNNAIAYLPLITKTGTLTINSKIWSYTTSIPTFHVIYNNTEYVVPNKYEEVSYDIAPGTYTPSAFKNLIDKYIYTNGSRKVSNSFTATVNNQTITVNANTTIYNVNNASSGSSVLSYAVNFSGKYLNAGNCFSSGVASSFTGNKVYITQSTGVITYFSHYMYYSITVSGIKFI